MFDNEIEARLVPDNPHWLWSVSAFFLWPREHIALIIAAIRKRAK